MLLMDLNYKIVLDHGKEAEQKYLNTFDVMNNNCYIIFKDIHIILV